ncbi:acyltransferase [Enterobacter mori]|uniref:acyltransferase n=1 Tax=Enterobacter mori TaxID=539813 RepID=UPI001BDFFB24|nr:acyltransferase [Enterobacter mori]
MNRNAGVDVLRIVSCLMVVCIHTCLNYSYGQETLNNYLALFGQSLFRMGLPVFFILSGFFILNSKVDFSAKSLFTKIKRVAIPFIVYSLIHWFIINKGVTISFSGLKEYFNALIIRNSISIHFWFVYSLIGIYIFSQPINYLLKDLSVNGCFFGLCIIAFLLLYNGDFPYVSNVLPVPGIDKWTAYFVAGGFIARIKDKVTSGQSLLLIIIGYFLIVYLSVYNGEKRLPMPYDFSISMFAACCGVVILFSKLKINNNIILIKLSASTYGAYLIHICVLKLLSPVYFAHFHKPGVINYFLTTCILSFFVFVVSMVISVIMLPIFNIRYIK